VKVGPCLGRENIGGREIARKMNDKSAWKGAQEATMRRFFFAEHKVKAGRYKKKNQ